MQTKGRLFDDAARLAGSALGTLSGVRREIETLVRQQIERLLDSMDLVTREEFDAVSAMAAKARAEQERLATRLAALEATLARRGATRSGRGKTMPKRGLARPRRAAKKPPAGK